MKLIDRKAFLEMPNGTIYSTYEPCICDSLSIKISNVGDNDWSYIPLDTISFINTEGSGDLYDKLLNLKPNDSIDTDISMNESYRDGVFDKDEMFMVFSRDEVEKLIGVLTQTLDMDAYKEKN